MYIDSYSDMRNRRRRRPKQEKENDTIISAVTIQVIICVVLVLALVICKKTDTNKYDIFKSDYISLVNDSGRNAESMQTLGGTINNLTGITDRFEVYIAGILENFFVQKTDGENTSPYIGDTEEPEEADMVIQPDEEEEPKGGSYHYLNDNTAFFAGAGGFQPVSVSLMAGDTNGFSAPAGSTFLPVALSGYMRPPVTGIITSQFGYRDHPITGIADFHTGMDIAAEEGANILAALPGEIKEVGESQIYGKYIILQHSMNFKTFYGHCSEILAVEGMSVRQGERIAKVGSTGISTGPHLHFAIIVEEQFADPRWLLERNIRVLEQS